MRCIILILLSFSFFFPAKADDDSFNDIDFEIDRDFPDDFTAIEQGSQSSRENFLHESLEPFSERGIRRNERSFGASLRTETVARVFHLSFTPEARFNLWKIDTHLALPLRFPIFDFIEKKKVGIRSRGFVNAEQFITPRPQDFRSVKDIQRIIRRVSLQNKNDNYSVFFGREQALTLAHGDLMREMNTEGLYDQDYLFFSGHAALDFLRVDALLGPLPSVSMLGLNARFMPLSSLNAHSFVKNANMDIGYIGDYKAPNEPFKQDEAFLLDKERRLVKRNAGTAQGLSFALASEYLPVAFFSTKPYASYSHLFLSGLSRNEEEPWRYGASFNLGHDATFFPVANNKRHMIIFNAEGRLFSQNYQPNYFGGHYMLDRVNFKEQGPLITKSQYVGFEENSAFHFGHLLELGYALDDMFNIKIGYENARSLNDGKSIQPLRKVHFNTGLFAFDALRLQMGYEVASILQLGDLFDFEKSRALLSLRGQVKLLPFLYFDTWIKHSFGINEKYQVAAKDGHLEPVWLSNRGETRSMNFGLGLELAMAF